NNYARAASGPAGESRRGSQLAVADSRHALLHEGKRRDILLERLVRESLRVGGDNGLLRHVGLGRLGENRVDPALNRLVVLQRFHDQRVDLDLIADLADQLGPYRVGELLRGGVVRRAGLGPGGQRQDRVVAVVDTVHRDVQLRLYQ